MSKVTVSFSIRVRGQMGGSFEMEEAEAKEFLSRWEGGSRRRHDETDLASEFLDMAPLNYFDHLNVDDMEIEELDVEPATGATP